jgi:anti-anti-sigma regulatory factor
MTFKIDTEVRGKFTVFVLTGRIEGQAIDELRRLLALHPDSRGVVLDLKDVRLVDRAVMRFLARSEADGVRLESCPAYVREWMEREND